MRRHAKAATAGSNRQKAARYALPASLFAALLALLVVVGSASATKFHGFKEVFGSAAQPTFTTSTAIAVDQSTGDVLVMDAGSPPSIKRYNADGTAADFSALSSNVIDGKEGADATPQNGLSFASASESQIAVDNSGAATDGDIYVTQGSPNLINVFSSAGEYLGQLTAAGAISFSEACGVAVDPSGAVYVGDYNGGIHKFTQPGTPHNPLENSDNTANFTTTSQPCTLAAGAGPTAGFLFAAKYSGEISKLDSSTGEVKYAVSTDSNRTVSVDPESGHVYAATGSSIKEFDASGASSASLISATSLSSQVQGIAVRGSTGDIYASRSGDSNLEVYGSTVLTQPDVTTEAATNNTGVHATLNGTVNPEGEEFEECLFEWGRQGVGVSEHTAPCAESNATIGAGTSPVAVHADISGLQPNGAIYLFRLAAKSPTSAKVTGSNKSFTTPDTVITEAASGIGPTAATLNGSVNPDGVAMTECLFEWGRSAEYGETAPCTPNAAGIGSGTSPVAVHAGLSGLEVGTTYHFRLRAANANGPILGKDKSLLTAGPVMPASWAQGVTYTEADVKAEIDPEGLATTFRVEYGPTAAYGQETAELAVDSDSSIHTVGAFLEGLSPGTTYHYRVIATNSAAANEGPDHTFTTYPPFAPNTNCANEEYRTGPGASLPDCRGYEMVSPVDKSGADVMPAFESVLLHVGSEQAALNGDKMAYVSRIPFGDAKSGLQGGDEYIASRGAGGWSSHAITPAHRDNVEPTVSIGMPPGVFSTFTPDLSTGFLWDNARPPLTPDALPAPYRDDYLWHASTESFEAITTEAFSSGTTELGFMGYSADGRHALIGGSKVQLTSTPTPAGSKQLYDFHDGELELVSVLPGGEASNAPFNTAGGAEESGGLTYHEEGEAARAISGDGSRIFWTGYASGFNAGGKIYARIDGETTIPVSEPVAPDKALYETASTDGSKVLFAFESGSHAEELYEFDVETETPTLIAGEVSPQFGVLGAGEDLSRIYFVSREALAAGATAGQRNLYLDENGTKTFIGALDARDFTSMTVANVEDVTQDFSQVTPDGRDLVFNSFAGLTGYDNTSLETGEAASEIYRYDAASGQLTCISCNPTGGRPETDSNPRPHHGESLDENFGVGAPQAAAWLPTRRRATYTPRMVSAGGNRVFFNSNDALAPQDTNGAQDVYEWESPGTGDCTERSPTYSAQDGGCIGLISSGESPEPSVFMDASEGGRDVFFRTAASIDPEDPGLIDIYDARVDGGFPRPESPPECLGDACQSPPSAPRQPTPASAGFHGVGNLKLANARDCGAQARRAARLARQAKLLRRRVKRTHAPKQARVLRKRSARLAKRAKGLSKRAKRCRRAERRAKR